jgi:hypothetical protein
MVQTKRNAFSLIPTIIPHPPTPSPSLEKGRNMTKYISFYVKRKVFPPL